MVNREASMLLPTQPRLVEGFSFEAIVHNWVREAFKEEVVILLLDVNPGMKPSSFWKKLPLESAEQFLEDVVILFPKDLSEAQRICESLTVDFAQCFVYYKGDILGTNLEKV